jgi:hypothetical protein
MTKPMLEVGLETFGGKTGSARAVFDTGSYQSLIREDRVPPGAVVDRPPTPVKLRTAAQGGKLHVVGAVVMTITIGNRMIQDDVLVSPDLSEEMLIGAKTMQAWDITIRSHNGHTEVVVGLDLRDPDVQEVD